MLTECTGSTLSAALFYLLHNPTILRRLQKEIRGTFSSAEEILMGAKMQSCTYLRACIDETLRMTPPVGGLLPREVLPGGLAIPALGLDLPAGINVGVPIYAIQHHAECVVAPFTFDPSRWLPAREGEEPHEQDKEALMAVWNPFSLGHRACLGKPLVYMELCIAIARILYDFDMRLSEEQHVSKFIVDDITKRRRRKSEYQLRDWFMSWNEGPWAEFRRRRD